jgi:hypothetical protein
MDLIEILHEENLTVVLSTISGLGSVAFPFLTTTTTTTTTTYLYEA